MAFLQGEGRRQGILYTNYPKNFQAGYVSPFQTSIRTTPLSRSGTLSPTQRNYWRPPFVNGWIPGKLH